MSKQTMASFEESFPGIANVTIEVTQEGDMAAPTGYSGSRATRALRLYAAHTRAVAPAWIGLALAGTTFRATVAIFAALALALIFGGHVHSPSSPVIIIY